MSKLKLTVNETKTRSCCLPDDTFNFLGYTFGRYYSHRTGQAYMGPNLGKKIARLCDAISELTARKSTRPDEVSMVGQINRKLRGWVNYFEVGTVSKAYHGVNDHVTYRLRRWLCAKHKVKGPGYKRFPNRYLHQDLGLFQLQRVARKVSCANV